MSKVQQVLRRKAPALTIVGADGRHAGHRTVDEHDREAILNGPLQRGQDRAHLVAETVDCAG